jgi:hypothetical protein
MRSDFYKLWGIVEDDLEVGTYELIISNDIRFDSYGIQKELVLTQLGSLGGTN